MPPPQHAGKRGLEICEERPPAEEDAIRRAKSGKCSPPWLQERTETQGETWQLTGRRASGNHVPFFPGKGPEEVLPEGFIAQIPHAVIANEKEAHFHTIHGHAVAQ